MKIILNPTNDPEMINSRIPAALGFIPPWVAEAFMFKPEDVIDHVMNTCYQMGGGPQADFTMQVDGTMQYPDDPPLTPIAEYRPPEPEVRMEQGWVYKVYQYDYGYVNFVSQVDGEDKHHMTRMD